MDAQWNEYPKWGTCITCGSSANADGFVDLIAETKIVRESYNIVGTVDIVLCADCLTFASRQIGCIPKKEAEDLRLSYLDCLERYDKVADEAHSWQQRYENLVEIMSLINPKEKAQNGNSTLSPESLFTSGPSPDTRVQEGRDIPAKSAGKTAKRS